VTKVTTKVVARLIGPEKLQNVMDVTIEELNDACFIVSDASGQKLGCFYFEEEQGRCHGRLLNNKTRRSEG
jgi:hypothetical protein